MTDRELLQQAMELMEVAIRSGDWKVDGACDPDMLFNSIRIKLAQPKPDIVYEEYPYITPTEWPLASKTGYYNIDGKRVWLEAEAPFPETAPPKNEPVIDKTMATRIATQLGWQPKKEWVGLTGDEVQNLTHRKISPWIWLLLKEFEQALKEKNG